LLFFGVRSARAGSRSRYSLSTKKRKNPFSAATVRDWLDAAGRGCASSARKARKSGTAIAGEVLQLPVHRKPSFGQAEKDVAATSSRFGLTGWLRKSPA
jgi:hypothetical protein